MKKFKILLVVTLLGVLFVLVGCGTNKVTDNISEITYVYYQGIDEQDKNVNASISVGQREEPYIMDGKHGTNLDFSLINVNFGRVLEEDSIEVELIINDNIEKIILEFNPLSNSYMTDLGYSIGSNENVQIKYQNYKINFKNVSDLFKVNYEKALEIGQDLLSDYIDSLYVNGIFEGEIYLKIFSQNSGNFDNLYWIFSVVGRNGQCENVAINVFDENDFYKN